MTLTSSSLASFKYILLLFNFMCVIPNYILYNVTLMSCTKDKNHFMVIQLYFYSVDPII